MKKTIVVFGATGKVGCYSVLYLKENGYDVIAVGRRKSDYTSDLELNTKWVGVVAHLRVAA